MKVEPTALPEVVVLVPPVFADDRGHFSESFNMKGFSDLTGFAGEFVQDNQSMSMRGVIRGLHYQLPPDAQGKLVRCIRGEVFDVAVDIRASSATFGQWVGAILSEDNHRQLWVPAGFGHGFLAMSEGAGLLYKTTAYYAPDSERSIRWDDPAIGIEWPDLGFDPMLNDRDRAAPTLDDADIFP